MQGTRRRDAAVAAALLALVLAAGLVAGVLTDKGREATPVIDTTPGQNSTEILLTVGTCLGEPEVSTLSESATEIVVSVVSAVQTGDGPRPACLDTVLLRLGRPLGDRTLIDSTTGRSIFVPAGQPR